MNNQLTVKDVQHGIWADMVRKHTSSGLSVREWCEQNHITPKTFYYRRKQVREELLASNATVFAELVPPVRSEVPAECRIFSPQMTITLNGATISVSRDTPLPLFEEFFRVIRNA